MDELKKSESGCVYIFTNPWYRCIKIGKTSRDAETRREELDNTSVPDEFEIYGILQTKQYSEVEDLIHRLLDPYRVRDNREFFNIEPKKALEEFVKVAKINKDATVIKYENGEPHHQVYPEVEEIQTNSPSHSNCCSKQVITYSGDEAWQKIEEFALEDWITQKINWDTEEVIGIAIPSTMALIYGERKTKERINKTLTVTNKELEEARNLRDEVNSIMFSLCNGLNHNRAESFIKAWRVSRGVLPPLGLNLEDFCNQIKIDSEKWRWSALDKLTTNGWIGRFDLVLSQASH